jgi:hypothetical protein
MFLVLKIVNNFEDLFIVNLNLFVVTLFNDSKNHVNLFIFLNNVILLIKCNF